jgi:hypothetical protein
MRAAAFARRSRGYERGASRSTASGRRGRPAPGARIGARPDQWPCRATSARPVYAICLRDDLAQVSTPTHLPDETKAPGSEDNIEENLALMLTEPEQFQRTRGWLDAKAANGSAS